MCNKAPEETSAASVPEEATLHEAKPSDVYADEESAQRIESQAPPAAPVVAQASPKQSRWLKYVSLFLLVFQNSALFLSLRLTATGHEKDDKYASTVVVFIVEIAKLAAAFVLYARQIKMGPLRTTSALWSQRRDMKLLPVPALCYTAQQNLIVMSRDFLSAPAMQVIGQSKTLWTAVFAFVVLKKRFTLIECTSFVLLCIGVVLIEHQDSDSQSEDAAQLAVSSGGRILGILMSGAAAALSGFAGIFLEKVYTKSGGTNSLWAKNVHLAIVSLPLQMIAVVQFDRDKIAAKGLFHGFHGDTFFFIAMQSFGGLLTGVVIKYAGNILKNFANALAILSTSFFSILLFAYHPTALFWLGVLGVSVATTMYGLPREYLMPYNCLIAVRRALAPSGQRAGLYKGEMRSDTDPDL